MSAAYVHCATLGMRINTAIVSRTRFRGTGIKVENNGHVAVFMDKYNDEYRITFPEAHLRGILTGRLFAELIGRTTITSRSGYTATIDFVAKPWFSGEYHTIKAEIFRTASPKDLVYTVKGKWTGTCEATHVPTGKKIQLADAHAMPELESVVKPVEEQGDNGSFFSSSSVFSFLNVTRCRVPQGVARDNAGAPRRGLLDGRAREERGRGRAARPPEAAPRGRRALEPRALCARRGPRPAHRRGRPERRRRLLLLAV